MRFARAWRRRPCGCVRRGDRCLRDSAVADVVIDGRAAGTGRRAGARGERADRRRDSVAGRSTLADPRCATRCGHGCPRDQPKVGIGHQSFGGNEAGPKEDTPGHHLCVSCRSCQTARAGAHAGYRSIRPRTRSGGYPQSTGNPALRCVPSSGTAITPPIDGQSASRVGGWSAGSRSTVPADRR
jgi:hypothetical protein